MVSLGYSYRCLPECMCYLVLSHMFFFSPQLLWNLLKASPVGLLLPYLLSGMLSSVNAGWNVSPSMFYNEVTFMIRLWNHWEREKEAPKSDWLVNLLFGMNFVPSPKHQWYLLDSVSRAWWSPHLEIPLRIPDYHDTQMAEYMRGVSCDLTHYCYGLDASCPQKLVYERMRECFRGEMTKLYM